MGPLRGTIGMEKVKRCVSTGSERTSSLLVVDPGDFVGHAAGRGRGREGLSERVAHERLEEVGHRLRRDRLAGVATEKTNPAIDAAGRSRTARRGSTMAPSAPPTRLSRELASRDSSAMTGMLAGENEASMRRSGRHRSQPRDACSRMGWSAVAGSVFAIVRPCRFQMRAKSRTDSVDQPSIRPVLSSISALSTCSRVVGLDSPQGH